MTDQPEPKYKIGGWVQLNSGFVDEIDSIVTEPDDDEPFYYTSFGDGESIPESDIKCAVAIHPIEHHKCKDCEHWYTKYDARDNNCPIVIWLHLQYAIVDALYDNENAEPPPNCYCFTPKGDKLSPDEKDSLKQSENDFATGKFSTKDEAFEKLGWSKESK